MKITLKLSRSKFMTLAELLNMVFNSPPPKDQEGKMMKSAMTRIIIKVQKKQIDLLSQTDSFNQKKKVNISFEYFEAFYIDALILVVRSRPEGFPVKFDEYQNNVLLQISSELNQKLL